MSKKLAKFLRGQRPEILELFTTASFTVHCRQRTPADLSIVCASVHYLAAYCKSSLWGA